MTRKSKRSNADIIKALKQAKGIQAVAAEALRVSRHAISYAIEHSPAVKAAYDEVNESTIDNVESKLMENIDAGNVVAQIFYLKTKGKHRGYVERQEVTGKDGEPINDEGAIYNRVLARVEERLADGKSAGTKKNSAGSKPK